MASFLPKMAANGEVYSLFQRWQQAFQIDRLQRTNPQTKTTPMDASRLALWLVLNLML